MELTLNIDNGLYETLEKYAKSNHLDIQGLIINELQKFVPDQSIKFFAHPSAIIDQNCTIGCGTKIWHFSHIMVGAFIGENCNLGQNVFVASNVQLGNNVKVQNNVSIYSGVICEDDVFLGPSMVFTNVTNPRSHVNRRNDYKQTIIKQGASIGANATILCGTTIGKYSFVGAGAVVTKDVPAYALVTGVPAKQIGWMSENGQRLNFDNMGFATCSETNDVYKLISDIEIQKVN